MRALLVVASLLLPVVALGGPEDIVLELRGQRVIDIKNVTRISVEDVSIVDAKPLNAGQVWLVATAVGETVVGVWQANGELATFKVKVQAPSPRALRVGGELLVEDDFDQIEATTPNVEVRIVSRGVGVIRAKGQGKGSVVMSKAGVVLRDVPIIVK